MTDKRMHVNALTLKELSKEELLKCCKTLVVGIHNILCHLSFEEGAMLSKIVADDLIALSVIFVETLNTHGAKEAMSALDSAFSRLAKHHAKTDPKKIIRLLQDALDASLNK